MAEEILGNPALIDWRPEQHSVTARLRLHGGSVVPEPGPLATSGTGASWATTLIEQTPAWDRLLDARLPSRWGEPLWSVRH